MRNKAHDPILHFLKIRQGLGHAQYQSVHTHRVHRHGGAGHNKTAPTGHRQGHADGVAATQHQRGGGRSHGGQQLGNGQPCLHIAAHGVENNQQALYIVAFLNGHQLRDYVLVLGGLILTGQNIVALDLADHR